MGITDDRDPMDETGVGYSADCGRYPLGADECHECTREYADD